MEESTMRHKWLAMSLLAPFAVALALNVGTIRTAEAAVVNSIVSVDGVPHQTTAIDTFVTTGNDMGGMEVTAFFADGSSQLATWAGLGGTSGSAVGTGWSLEVHGDTFGAIWILTNDVDGLTMTGLRIYAAPGDTMFDRTLDFSGDEFGTPGSARGWDFDAVAGPDGLLIDVTYSDIVNLTGDAPFGDLYATMTLALSGLRPGEILEFIADTDNALVSGDIRPRPVPEPAAIALIGIGLLGLGLAVHRRRRAA
jgi:hypothetical protein